MAGGWDEYNYWRKRRNEAKPYRVYYCRDVTGSIIYVGCTSNWTIRERMHETDTPWWAEVDVVTFSASWMTRTDALAFEARAIRFLRPRHNVIHNPDVRSTATRPYERTYRDLSDPLHGTVARAANFGCRCDPCRAAVRERVRKNERKPATT